MSAVVSGMIGAVVASVLIALAKRTQGASTKLRDGWQALRPGWLIHAAMAFCVGFGGLLSHFLLSGGSSRADASTQNLIALLLFAAAAGGATYVGWTCYLRTIIWKGDELRVRPILGHETARRLSDVAKVTSSEMRGEYRLIFQDGSRIWLSEHMHGARDLIAKLPRRAFSD